MTARAFSRGGIVILGHSIPLAVAWLASLTAGASIIGALYAPLPAGAALVARDVWGGEVWRLLTWVFFEMHPISLVFACLMLVWLGPDLCQVWGMRRFVAVYLGCAAAAGALTSLLARLLPQSGLSNVPYLSAWAAIEPAIIAWAWYYPNRRIFVAFVLPAQGRTLIQATIALTVLFAVFQGWQLFVPHFIAQGLALLYLDHLRFVRRVWLRVRLAAYQRQLQRRVSRFTVVGRDDERHPPTYH